ncbi:MAG: hypothetical protein K6F59_04750 [Gammaproteobacteria bacterium]|nr:hypothetical protein [Gammaproteobacteria bacterium]
MKKRIIPLGISTLIYGIVFLAIAGLSIFITIQQCSPKVELQWWRLVIVWVLFLAVAYLFVSSTLMYVIRIDNNLISMKKDFGLFEEDRVQSAETVDLTTVREYKVILSDKNSKGEPYKTKVAKRRFISFTINDEEGTEKRFFIHYLNNKQALALLNYIKEKTGLDAVTE